MLFDKKEDEQDRDAWISIMTSYDAAMEILWQQMEYTDDDIEKNQDHIDAFFPRVHQNRWSWRYNKLYSPAWQWACEILYARALKFVQIFSTGMGIPERKVQTGFFNHTQREGNSRKYFEESEKSYLFSVMKVFQWELLWISGDAENYFRTVHN